MFLKNNSTVFFVAAKSIFNCFNSNNKLNMMIVDLGQEMSALKCFVMEIFELWGSLVGNVLSCSRRCCTEVVNRRCVAQLCWSQIAKQMVLVDEVVVFLFLVVLVIMLLVMVSRVVFHGFANCCTGRGVAVHGLAIQSFTEPSLLLFLCVAVHVIHSCFVLFSLPFLPHL